MALAIYPKNIIGSENNQSISHLIKLMREDGCTEISVMHTELSDRLNESLKGLEIMRAPHGTRQPYVHAHTQLNKAYQRLMGSFIVRAFWGQGKDIPTFIESYDKAYKTALDVIDRENNPAEY